MENYLFYFKTSKTNNIKKLFEVLKEIVQTDYILIISPDGIRMNKEDLLTMNVVSMKLEASDFEEYYCNEKVFVMLNSKPVYIVTKTVLNTDIISFYITKDDPWKLQICNTDKTGETESISKITRLDCENQKEMRIADITGYNTTKILSSKFNKICKDFNNLLSDHIIITDNDTNITFSCITDEYIQNVVIRQEPDTLNKKLMNKVSGKYRLKSIIPFIKGVNLTDNDNNVIKLHITNTKLLVIQYNIGCLGNIRLITREYTK